MLAMLSRTEAIDQVMCIFLRNFLFFGHNFSFNFDSQKVLSLLMTVLNLLKISARQNRGLNFE